MRALIAAVILVCSAGAAHAWGDRDDRKEARFLAHMAATMYERNGEAAFDVITSSGRFIDGDIYAFVADPLNREILAHAATPALVGTAITARVGEDEDDMNIIDAMFMKAAGEYPKGDWIKYEWLRPSTGQTEEKRSYVVLRDGLLFGSGVYE